MQRDLRTSVRRSFFCVHLTICVFFLYLHIVDQILIRMLEDIKSNIAKLVALYEAERQRAATLEERLRQCEEKSLEYKKQITDLNQQIANLELMHAFQASGDPVTSRDRIGKLIKEIDRCIKLLES